MHRDIKPDNIVLASAADSASADSAPRPLLVDFGGVQDVLTNAPPDDDDSNSNSNARGDSWGGNVPLGTTIVGTAGYTPPEQFGGGASTASDMCAAVFC